MGVRAIHRSRERLARRHYAPESSGVGEGGGGVGGGVEGVEVEGVGAGVG